MTDKKLLLQNFLKDNEIPLFYKPEWLDAVCGQYGWEPILATDSNGTILAYMPIHQRKKYGIKAIISPRLTPYGGIVFFPPKNLDKRSSLYSFYKKYTKEIIDQFPKFHYFNVAMHPDFVDCQPFAGSGFSNRIRYTYRIDKSVSQEEAWNNLDAKTRNDITSAQQNVTIKPSKDFSLFHKLNKSGFAAQQIEMVYDEKFIESLDLAIGDKLGNNSSLLLAYHNGELIAGIYTVADYDCVYYLASGKNQNAPRGTVSLLIWEMIKTALNEGKIFDFEGSDIPNIEVFFRSFGGKLTPYFQISKASNKLFDLGFRAIGKL